MNLPELTTPTNAALKLNGAGWTQATPTTWTHPESGHEHSYAVALCISDLPRIIPEDGLGVKRGRPPGKLGRPQVD